MQNTHFFSIVFDPSIFLCTLVFRILVICMLILESVDSASGPFFKRPIFYFKFSNVLNANNYFLNLTILEVVFFFIFSCFYFFVVRFLFFCIVKEEGQYFTVSIFYIFIYG